MSAMRVLLSCLVIALAACSPRETPLEKDSPEQATAAPVAKFNIIAGDDVFSMIIPANMTPEQIIAAARDQCGAREFCQVHGWLKATDAARALPMTDREFEALAFQYAHNRTSGFESRSYNCDVWPTAGPEECLSSPK